MCQFASFVLTKYDAYYLNGSDSHEDIIEYYNLPDQKVEIVRIELLPPEQEKDILNVEKWEFKVDQDEYPDWTYEGDPVLEEMARKALIKRIEEQKIGKIVEVGNFDTAIGGVHSYVISGRKGISIGSHHAEVVSGESGISIVKDDGCLITDYGGYGIANENNEVKLGVESCLIGGNNNFVTAKTSSILVLGADNDISLEAYCHLTAHDYNKIKALNDCKIIVEDGNNIEAGNNSQIFAGKRNKITVGTYSEVFAENGSEIKAGLGSFICINSVIGLVGENGLEANVFYKAGNKQFVKVEDE
jgi:hypothetical protein